MVLRFINALIKSGRKKKKCSHNMVQVVPEFDRWKCVWCGHEERHKDLNDIL